MASQSCCYFQPITSHLPHFADPDPAHETQRQADTTAWWRTLDAIRLAFREGAIRHMKRVEKVPGEAAKFHSYFRSGEAVIFSCYLTTCLLGWGLLSKIHVKSHVIQIKYGLPYWVTCPSLSTDPGSLKPGTRRSRVPGWWDPGIQ